MADETEYIDLGDLAPVEISYRIGGRPYLLREADAAAAAKYRNFMMDATRMTDGKVTGVRNLADAEPLLVSLCLFEQGKDAWIPVSIVTVKGWPSRVVKQLYEKARAISQLDERAPGDAPGKSEPSATPDTSG